LLSARSRQFGGDEATKGVAGELGVVQARRVEPAPEPFAQLCGAHRMAEAWKIDYVHAPLRCQLPEHRGPPPPGSREPVNEHERLAAAGYSVPDGATVDLDLVELHRHLTQSGRCSRLSCSLRLECTHSLGTEK
jgi:hypothetical protein